MHQIAEKTKQIDFAQVADFFESVLDFGGEFNLGGMTINFNLGAILLIALLFFLTRILMRSIRRLLAKSYLFKNEDDQLKFSGLFKVIQTFIYIVLFLISLSVLGLDVNGIFTAAAGILLGLGFALKEFLQDTLGYFMLISSKSIETGDVIEVEGIVGKVVELSFGTTKILTRDDKIIIVPNHKLVTQSVYNFTQNHKATRESVSVGVAYESDVNKVKQLLVDIALSHQLILAKPEPFVFFEDFGDSSLLFKVSFYTENSFLSNQIKSDLRFQIMNAFQKEGITIPFPQRDVHLISKKGEDV